MFPSPKALSLVIPTYNRGRYLDNQIAWAVESIGNMWPSVELVICDNASTDNTPDICAKWQGILSDDKFRVFRNSENVGLVKNCLLSVQRAVGNFVWLVGDDDPIDSSAVEKVLFIINGYSNLNIIHLNHRCISGPTGEVVIPRFYSISNDIYADGKGALELSKLLQSQHTGGFMFITANVVNRHKALDFIKKYPPEEDLLLAYPMLLNAGLASLGPFYLVHDCLLDCIYDQSSWSDRYEQVHYREVPETLCKLISMGVSKSAVNSCLNFQFRGILSVRDIIYKIRNQKKYINHPEFKQWLRRWKSKETIKWKMLFQ
jgi:glycosyltransferase involved in cell wall biosynthesis